MNISTFFSLLEGLPHMIKIYIIPRHKNEALNFYFIKVVLKPQILSNKNFQ